MRDLIRYLPVLAALVLVLGFLQPGRADEPGGGGAAPAGEEPAPGGKPGDKPPADEEDDPRADEADDKVPFVEEVNRAIEQGSVYLLLRPYGPKQKAVVRVEGANKGKDLGDFKVPRVDVLPGYEEEKGAERVEGAHWGWIDSPKFYGGADGEAYREPAGPTALALYALLKCGEDPKNPVIKKGFNWLRQIHRVDKDWDGNDMRDRWWIHSVAGSSYEVSAMILAVTSKYDTHKRTKNTQAKRKKGKLKISDKEDRFWLEQMVDLLVRRRGEPGTKPINLSRSDFERLADYTKEKSLPPENPNLQPKDRLGWRYNAPAINMIKSGGGGGRGRSSTESLNRVHGLTAPGANQDLSSTQLAALALFNAHQLGVKPANAVAVWGDIAEMTLLHQEKTGPERKRHDPMAGAGGYGFTPKVDHERGFMYIPGSPNDHEGVATGAMTACGVANLVMARSVLLENEEGQAEFLKRGFAAKDAKTGQNVVDTAIYDGLAWLDANWSPFDNPRGGGYHIYYLYALERAMDLLGKNLVGTHLWYTEGARAILGRQQKTSVRNPLEKNRNMDAIFWDTDSTHEPQDVLDTAFALLFLKRATKDLIPVEVTGGDGAPVDNR